MNDRAPLSREQLIETIELLAEGDGIDRKESLALAQDCLRYMDELEEMDAKNYLGRSRLDQANDELMLRKLLAAVKAERDRYMEALEEIAADRAFPDVWSQGLAMDALAGKEESNPERTRSGDPLSDWR
jgi:hypothetical protein